MHQELFGIELASMKKARIVAHVRSKLLVKRSEARISNASYLLFKFRARKWKNITSQQEATCDVACRIEQFFVGRFQVPDFEQFACKEQTGCSMHDFFPPARPHLALRAGKNF